MPQHAEIIPLNNNYTLLKLIRIGISPICAMIGTSAYYGQLIGNPILGSINALLFSKKLGIDIWNLNQMPSLKSKLLNSSKKIVLGLGTIGLVNYSKFVNTIEPIEPNTTPMPITTSTTTVNPFPDLLGQNIDFMEQNSKFMGQIDWDTYISLSSYAIANLLTGILEIIPNKFESIRQIANMATGGCLISSGVAMGINNDFNNAYAVPTIIAGVSEIIHNLLPIETINNYEELPESTFNNIDPRFTINSEISSTTSQYGSNISEDNTSLNWDYNHMSL